MSRKTTGKWYVAYRKNNSRDEVLKMKYDIRTTIYDIIR